MQSPSLSGHDPLSGITTNQEVKVSQKREPEKAESGGRKYLVVHSESQQIGWTTSPKLASSIGTIRQFIKDNQMKLSLEDLKTVVHYSRDQRLMTGLYISNHSILGKLPQMLQKSISSIVNYIVDKNLTKEVRQESRERLEKSEGNFKQALDTAAIPDKIAKLKTLKSDLSGLMEIKERHSEDKLENLDGEIEFLQRQIRTSQRELRQGLNPICKKFLDENEHDGESAKQIKEHLRNEYPEILRLRSQVQINKSLEKRVKISEESEINLVEKEQLEGTKIKIKTDTTDRYLAGKRDFYPRGPEGSNIKRKMEEEGFSLNSHSKTLEELAQVENPTIEDLSNAGFRDLVRLFNASRVEVGFKAKTVSFVLSKLSDFLGSRELAQSDLQTLKADFLKELDKAAIQKKSFTREEFETMRNKGEISEANDFNKFQKAYNEGTWKPGETRELTFENIPLDQKEGVLKCTDQLFELPAFKTIFQKLA